MSYDYLVDHAQKNVWCTPNQDHQTIVKPARLTPVGGAWNKVTVLWRTMSLPEQGPRFHVYQVGQIHPRLMGLFDAPIETWESLADCAKRQNVITDLYNTAGVQMPRVQTWYRVTRDKDLILAVKRQPGITGVSFDTDDLFLRIYENAYFNSSEADAMADYIDVQGGTLQTSDDIMALQTQYYNASLLPGCVYAFVNGMRVKEISFITCKTGDVAEYVYDSSVYLTQEWTVGDLPSFDSTLDLKHKFLLHYAGAGARGIDFYDDVDVFLYKPGDAGQFSGVFYHRNQLDAVRMVTHKDYAIPVAYVTGQAAYQAGWSDVVSTLKVRLQIRKSGYHRPLVYDNQRIQELYKMADADVLAAMVGLNATVPVWQASALEASGYTHLMRANLPEINRQLVQDAYGYNAISKLLGDTPKAVTTVNAMAQVDVAYGLVNNSTAYEYDSNGLLLGWNRHSYGTVYNPVNAGAAMVEQVVGTVGTRLQEVYGADSVLLNSAVEYRMYMCGLVGGIPDNKFVDVTATGNYAVVNNVLTWLCDPTRYYPMVRGNQISLGYTLNLPIQAGNLTFSLMHEQIRNGNLGSWVMQVPMGQLDLWLNGYSLIEGLDYFVQFPQIVITNKTFLVNPATDPQKVSLRFSGFCRADLSREPAQDPGFVKYALLSKNNRFDIRDDKVLRIVVDGKLCLRSQLLFAETDPGVTVPDARNGAPYLIRDVVVPFKGTAVSDTYVLRQAAEVIDQSISNYMTQKLPEVSYNTPDAIPQRYAIFSPFCCRILNDLASGVLNPAVMYERMSDQDVFNICKPYEYLLAFDPTQDQNAVDDDFVIIHPHNLYTTMTLNFYQYRLALRMVNLYLKSKVTLASFVQMTS